MPNHTDFTASMKRLAPAVAGAGAAAMLLTVPAANAAESAPAAPAAKAAPASPAGTESYHYKSFKCSSPKGRNLNVSWDPGLDSTTIYFNNHCKQKRKIKAYLADQFASNGVRAGEYKCLTVNPRTKGKKKIWNWVIKVTSPKSC
ncbi:hypothetical protein [Actinomadura yumaensis]|uniref:Ig-like domain-containing protein n=1 Tax=Actinomadura yumaensis TaxID=111807 RepID=A0ABW2CNG8_9ACTN